MKEQNKEYGGYIPLETTGREYYCDRKEYSTVRFNSARYAIVEAFRNSKCKKLWIPYYTCKSVYDALDESGITYESYNISEKMLPEIYERNHDYDQCILATNYFGLMDDDFYNKIRNVFSSVIFDNTQAFFAKPIIGRRVYNVYSPRKFFGVSDGAYLLCEEYDNMHGYEKDHSAHRAGYLMRAIEDGTNAAYSDYLKSEEDITKTGVRKMSDLSRAIMCMIDYDYVIRKRIENFNRLHSILGAYNGLDKSLFKNPGIPMVYPFLLQKDDHDGMIRKRILEKKLYISQWWKWVLDNEKATVYEKYLSANLFPLPIDQRYSGDDMDAIGKLVLEEML